MVVLTEFVISKLVMWAHYHIICNAWNGSKISLVRGQPHLILPKVVTGCAQLNVGESIISYAGWKVTTVNANDFKEDTVLWQ